MINTSDLITDHFNNSSLRPSTCVLWILKFCFRPCAENIHGQLLKVICRGKHGKGLHFRSSWRQVSKVSVLNALSLLVFAVNRMQGFYVVLQNIILCSEDICSHISSCLAGVSCGLYLKVTCLEYGQVSVSICRFWYAVINTFRIVFIKFLLVM